MTVYRKLKDKINSEGRIERNPSFYIEPFSREKTTMKEPVYSRSQIKIEQEEKDFIEFIKKFEYYNYREINEIKGLIKEYCTNQ